MGSGLIAKELLREYGREGNIAKNLLEKRLKEVYEQIPRVEEIDYVINMTGIKLTKLILERSMTVEEKEKVIKELKEQSQSLVDEKNSLLSQHKYSKSFFTEVYKCKVCRDTGFVEGDKCTCFKQRIINKFYEMSNLSDIIKDENFDTFDIRYYRSETMETEKYSPRANMQLVWQVCLKFTNSFDTEFTNLYFFGNTGLGKTFLCSCIAKELMDKGKTVLYVTAAGLFKKIEDFRFNKHPDEDGTRSELIDLIYTVDLLIVDDLGTEFATSVTNSEFFNFINTRLLERKPTIISSNLTPNQLENQYSYRIISRILGQYKALRFYGDDIRIQKKHGIGRVAK